MKLLLVFVVLFLPAAATSKSNRLFTGRRQLGFQKQPPLLPPFLPPAVAVLRGGALHLKKNNKNNNNANGPLSSSSAGKGAAAALAPLSATAAALTATSSEAVAFTALSGGRGGSGPGIHLPAWLHSRGGSSRSSSSSATATTPTSRNNALGNLLTRRNLSVLLLSVAGLALVYRYRAILLNREKIQDETLLLLRRLYDSDSPTSSLSKSLAMYGGGMAVWEFLGMSTIPVETAAGMVFGWPAMLAGFGGKLVGALATFCVGRQFLLEKAQAKLVNYKLFQQLLLQQKQLSKAMGAAGSAATIRWQSRPITTAFLMKFSCFPELVKNVGTSLLSSVGVSTFAVATLVHGGMFTALWTWWGVQTAALMRDPTLVASRGLQGALLACAFLGLVISPALMAWWIRDLQRMQGKDITANTTTKNASVNSL